MKLTAGKLGKKLMVPLMVESSKITKKLINFIILFIFHESYI